MTETKDATEMTTEEMGDTTGGGDLEFDTLEDLMEFEGSTHYDGEELLEMSHDAWQMMSEALREELSDKAREVIAIVNPEYADEIEDGEIFVADKYAGDFYFGVCLGEVEGGAGVGDEEGEGEADHNHQMVCRIPAAALALNEEGWKQFLGMVSFLDSNGIFDFEV